jgi:hypothetical protein
MKSIISKKGQLGGLQGIILTLVVVGILLGCGYLVLETLRDEMRSVTTVTNEKIQPASPNGVYLAYNSTRLGMQCYGKATVTSVVNESGGATISAGNYTLNPDTGLFKNLSSNINYQEGWNVSYTFENGSSGCSGVASTITATNNVNTFLPIIIIVAIVGILLAIVFSILLPKTGFGRGGATAEI